VISSELTHTMYLQKKKQLL